MGRSLNPDDAVATMRAAGVEPLAPYPGSAGRWECRCLRCGQVVYPEHRSVKRGQGGCAFCGRADALAAIRVDPEAAARLMLDAGLRPLEPYSTSRAKWRSECLACGKVVLAIYSSVQRGRGCPACGRKRGGVKRRHSHDFAAVAMRDVGLEPLEPYPGTDATWRCTCLACGGEVATTRDSVRKAGRGCPACDMPGKRPPAGRGTSAGDRS